MSPSPDRRPGGRSQGRSTGPTDRGPRRGSGGDPPNRSFSRPAGRPPRPGAPRPEPGRDRDGGRYAAEPGAGRFERPGAERRAYTPREGQRFEPRRDRAPYGGRDGEGSRGAVGRPPEGRGAADRRPRRTDVRAPFQGRRGPDRFGADRPSAPRFRDGQAQRRVPFGAPSVRPPAPMLFSRGSGAAAPAPAADRERSEAESFAAAAPSDLIWGRHTAQAALESGRPVHRIWCTPEMRFSPRFLQLLREAKASGVLVEEVTWARLGQISGGAVHQGIVLQPAAVDTLDLPSLIEGCRGIGEAPLLLAVDGLTDPQNLGAIVRSAEALGAHGLVLPQRRNAGLTGSVAKVAAGALEHLPIARVVNLNRSLDTLKQEGYRVIGLAGEGTVSLEEADLEGPLVIVTGSEGDGLSLLTSRNCDQLVRIPLRGATPSLNASVATALLLYEVARRSWMKGLAGTSPAPRLVRPTLPTPAPVEAVPSPLDPEPASSLDDGAMDDGAMDIETMEPMDIEPLDDGATDDGAASAAPTWLAPDPDLQPAGEAQATELLWPEPTAGEVPSSEVSAAGESVESPASGGESSAEAVEPSLTEAPHEGAAPPAGIGDTEAPEGSTPTSWHATVAPEPSLFQADIRL
ncbi:MAG: 23S rRNA (guanosine(2251)-2'-O)-methyltransferase RlmB [Cyanobacteria bacterium]|nr:23S rRNA (guanosine(2251)-2'-O)-methyltransferase RlmB [Cyanobacteriota bacterium]